MTFHSGRSLEPLELVPTPGDFAAPTSKRGSQADIDRVQRGQKAFTTRRVDFADVAGLARSGRPRAGDLVLARVESIGQHPRLELHSGRRAKLAQDALRKALADERRVPAYIVFGDNTLRAMARYYPATVGEMEGIPGMGEKKRAEFGEAFAAEIAAYLQTNSRMAFD